MITVGTDEKVDKNLFESSCQSDFQELGLSKNPNSRSPLVSNDETLNIVKKESQEFQDQPHLLFYFLFLWAKIMTYFKHNSSNICAMWLWGRGEQRFSYKSLREKICLIWFKDQIMFMACVLYNEKYEQKQSNSC